MTEVSECQHWPSKHEHTMKPSGEFCELVKQFVGEVKTPMDSKWMKKVRGKWKKPGKDDDDEK